MRSEFTINFHVGGAKASLWLCHSGKFVSQNMGGSEWVRSQNRLCAWRCKDWHGLMNLVTIISRYTRVPITLSVYVSYLLEAGLIWYEAM